MKLDKKTIFSIFIVLLFVGSMFAMVAYGGRNNTSNVPTDTIPTDTNQEPVNYQAQFDANVTEIFPQLIIAGKPIEYETTVIESKLLDLQGIKKKTIEYRQATDGNISLIITINISADKKEEIISGIKDFNIIQEPIEMYQYAMLAVPEDINFTNDQNQEINYTFGAVPMEGIININTVKGDEITTVCYASFVGQELVSAKGIEMYNLSSQPQMVISNGKFNILSWKPLIYLSTDINSDNNIVIATLENKLSDYNVEMDKGGEKLTIVFSEETINTQTINKIFTDNSFDTNLNTYKKLAIIDTSDLTIEGQAYTYANPTTETLLDYPEDLNKTSIELNIQAYKQKENILFLSLQK
ncbi:MAG: hypothetical protein WCX82_04110 [archaeon]|jgi:hypothetical protein